MLITLFSDYEFSEEHVDCQGKVCAGAACNKHPSVIQLPTVFGTSISCCRRMPAYRQTALFHSESRAAGSPIPIWKRYAWEPNL